MSLIRVISLFLCLIFTATAAQPQEIQMVKVKAQEESEKLSREVGRLLLAKKYGDLEILYAKNEGVCFDDGAVAVAAFGRYFEELDPKSVTEVDRIGACLSEWAAKDPKSSLARGLQIQFFVDKAWWYRGGTWAKNVRPDKWAPFQENLVEAGRLFEKCRSEGLSSPIAWSNILRVAMGLGAKTEDQDALFAEAIKEFPRDKLIVPARIVALLPRWGGKEGEWEKALLAHFDITNPADHLFIYKIASHHICREHTYKFHPPLTWPLLRSCYETAVKTMKDPLAFDNRQCRMAFDQRDYAEADRLFKKVRQYGSWSAWDSVEQFENYRKIAAEKSGVVK